VREQASDADLLSAIAGCDGQAFAVFYRRHLPAVLAYLMRETRDLEAAADLAAKVFPAVPPALRSSRAVAPSAAPWVIGIPHDELWVSLRKGRGDTR